MVTIKLTDELAQRLVEIHRWQRTGLLEDGALRKFAKKNTRARNDVRAAETETFSEVAMLVAKAMEK